MKPSPEVLKVVKSLELSTRRLVDALMSGDYLSLYKGRGTEFFEIREYQPGDDIRSIDWNVTARMGGPYVKRYIEEKELPVMLLVDGSGSTRFGTGEKAKAEVALELSAFLGMAALKKSNPLGLLIFTDRVEVFCPPRKGRKQLLHILSSLATFRPKGIGTDIASALRTFNRVVKRRCIAFIISDFLAEDYQIPLRGAAKRHDIVPIVLRDKREEILPDVGMLELIDMETGGRIIVDSRKKDLLNRFSHNILLKEMEMDEVFRSLDLDFIRLKTDEPYFKPLKGFFLRRREIRRRIAC